MGMTEVVYLLMPGLLAPVLKKERSFQAPRGFEEVSCRDRAQENMIPENSWRSGKRAGTLIKHR